MKSAEFWAEHTKRQPPLTVGDHVRIQNQVGPHPLKWDKTGIVIEVCQFDKYAIKVDGSGRVTPRNRKFLRKFQPVYQRTPRYSIPFSHLQHLTPSIIRKNDDTHNHETSQQPVIPHLPDDSFPHVPTLSSDDLDTPDIFLKSSTHPQNPPLSRNTADKSPPSSPAETHTIPRRSTRTKVLPSYLSDYELS